MITELKLCRKCGKRTVHETFTVNGKTEYICLEKHATQYTESHPHPQQLWPVQTKSGAD